NSRETRCTGNIAASATNQGGQVTQFELRYEAVPRDRIGFIQVDRCAGEFGTRGFCRFGCRIRSRTCQAFTDKRKIRRPYDAARLQDHDCMLKYVLELSHVARPG